MSHRLIDAREVRVITTLGKVLWTPQTRRVVMLECRPTLQPAAVRWLVALVVVLGAALLLAGWALGSAAVR